MSVQGSRFKVQGSEASDQRSPVSDQFKSFCWLIADCWSLTADLSFKVHGSRFKGFSKYI
jgi:hypothetical protein